MNWIARAAAAALAAWAAPAMSQPPESKPSCDREVRRILAEKARGGDPKAQYQVGVALETGECGDKDVDRAAEWLVESANQNFPPAVHMLGVILRREGEARMALAFFEKAARLGHRGAEADMGFTLGDANSAARDDTLAYAWLSLAASRDQPADLKALLRRSVAQIEQGFNADSRRRAEALKAQVAAGFGPVQRWNGD
jgi:TPR repeat protein